MKRFAVSLAVLFLTLCLIKDGSATPWPGPDASNYTGSVITYDFGDISGTGISVSLDDDEVSGVIPIGFTFNFYDTDFTGIYVSSNGFITFEPDSEDGCCEGQDIPDTWSPNNLIAGYWTDLDPSSGGTIHYETAGSPGSRRFTVQFMEVPLLGGETTASFQIILHEGTNNIEMQFLECSSNELQTYVTGIENSDGTAALQYNFGDYSVSNLGILISPPPLSITLHPADQSVCSGSIVLFSAAASGTPAPSVQWQVSANGGAAWSNISGETATTLTVAANSSNNSYRYRAVFYNGSSAATDAAVLTVSTVIVTSSAVPDGTAGVSYTATQLDSTGGTGISTYAVTGGALPAGMGLSPSGLLSGTPLQTGSFPFTVTATSSGGCIGARNITLNIDCAVLTVSPATVPEGFPGQVYDPIQFSSTGGIGTVLYAITSGALPTGMGLSSSGLLSGTPLQTGSFIITVTATDSNGCTGSQSITLNIGCAVLTVSPATLPEGFPGQVYDPIQFSSTGGIGTVLYAITSGTLPTGMSLTTAGLLSGTPTQTGSFQFAVTATDSNGCIGSRRYNLIIDLNNSATVAASNGSGNITLTTSSPGCWFSNVLSKTEAQVGNDPGFAYPYGLIEFTVNCSNADVTITFPGDITGTTYRKYGPTTPGDFSTTAWYNFADVTINSSTSITLHLVDGLLGDDTAVDGIIVAQGGPALPNSGAVMVPTINEWGMIIFMLLAGIGSIYYMERRRKALHNKGIF